MRSITQVSAVGGLLVAAALAGCGGDETTVTETVVQTQPDTTGTIATAPASDTDAAQAVLAGIVDRDRNDPQYHSTGFKTDPAISDAFLSAIDVIEQQNKQQGFPGLDFDPILCAQQIPRGVSYAPRESGEEGRVTVVATYEYGGGKPVKVRYTMVRDGEDWKLGGTDCVEQAVGGEE